MQCVDICHNVLMAAAAVPSTRSSRWTAACRVCRVKRLAALCANYDGVIAAGVYMTLRTPGSGGSGSAAASDGAAMHDMNSSGADGGGEAAAGGGGAATTSARESAGEGGEDAALAGGGATAAITRKLRSGGGGGDGSSSSSSDMQPVGRDGGVSGGGTVSSERGGRRRLLDRSGQVGRAVLQAGKAAAAEPGDALEQAVHRLSRLHAKLEAEGEGASWVNVWLPAGCPLGVQQDIWLSLKPCGSSGWASPQVLEQGRQQASKHPSPGVSQKTCEPCAGRCQLDMALYSEDHPAGDTEPVYPINAVRNRALQMVETQVGGASRHTAKELKIAHVRLRPGRQGMHPHMCITMAAAACACVLWLPVNDDVGVTKHAPHQVVPLASSIAQSAVLGKTVRRGSDPPSAADAPTP